MGIVTQKNSVAENVQKKEQSNIKQILCISLIAVFVILGLALIVSGSCGALPLLPALIPGIILLLSVGILVTGRVLGKRVLTGTQHNDGIGRLKFNGRLFEKAKKWCLSELERRLLVKDPEDPSALANDYFYKNNQVDPGCKTIYRICHNEYPEAFRLICSYFDECRSPVTHLGVVVGCYVILMQSLIDIREIVADIPRPFTEDDPVYQALSPNERVAYLLSKCHRFRLRNSPNTRQFLGVQAGAFWLFRSYMALRTGKMSVHRSREQPASEEDFLKPGTDSYFARELFNDARQALMSVFSLKHLQKYYEEEDVVKPLCDMCRVPDNGDTEFLKTHQNYEYKDRASGEIFCN